MEKDFKLCVTLTTTKEPKVSLKYIPNSEEEILLVSLVVQERLKEENSQLLQEKSFYFHHVFTCFHKLTLVSRTKNLDTERDI